MTAIEKSNKLPIGYSVELMKICEGCEIADLEIRNAELYCGNVKTICGTITCKNIQICGRLCEMYEESKQ